VWGGTGAGVGGTIVPIASRAPIPVLAVAALLVAGLPAAAVASNAITPTAIGGARLGASAETYAALLGKPFVTAYADGSTRLVVGRGEIQVYIGAKTKRGVAVVVSSSGFKLANGIHPCSPIAALTRAYGRRLVAIRLPAHSQPVAYRLGSLLFTVSPARDVGAVALLAPGAPLSLVTGSGVCGQGEEG
jgi:hypothetical protein